MVLLDFFLYYHFVGSSSSSGGNDTDYLPFFGSGSVVCLVYNHLFRCCYHLFWTIFVLYLSWLPKSNISICDKSKFDSSYVKGCSTVIHFSIIWISYSSMNSFIIGFFDTPSYFNSSPLPWLPSKSFN